MYLSETFRDKTLLITGATGFVGKVVLARVLALCPDLRRIYVLIRDKSSAGYEARFEKEIVASEAFENLRDALRRKVVPVRGNALHAGVLAIELKRRELCEEVQHVVNCIGSIDMTESLRRAVENNLLTLSNMLELAQRMRNLQSFVHVSSAYVNAFRDGVIAESEVPHLPGVDPEVVLQQVMLMTEEKAEHLAARVRGPFPNSHLFVKAVGEKMIEQRGYNMRIVVLRPSLICAAFKYPVPGWIDSTNGVGAFVLLTGLGVIQRAAVRAAYVVDVVPVDYVAHAAIIATMAAAHRHPLPRTMHVATSSINPLTWEQVRLLCLN